MKKKMCVLVVFALFLNTVIFAEESPVSGWEWEDGVQLNGKWFYDVADSYREQDGWVYLEGFGKIHYWLYDTYTYHNGYGREILTKCIPKWVENMGYIVDYDNIKKYSPNENLATSVKTLMLSRGYDISVALINADKASPYVVINSYDADGKYFFTYIYYLIRQ